MIWLAVSLYHKSPNVMPCIKSKHLVKLTLRVLIKLSLLTVMVDMIFYKTFPMQNISLSSTVQKAVLLKKTKTRKMWSNNIEQWLKLSYLLLHGFEHQPSDIGEDQTSLQI